METPVSGLGLVSCAHLEGSAPIASKRGADLNLHLDEPEVSPEPPFPGDGRGTHPACASRPGDSCQRGCSGINRSRDGEPWPCQAFRPTPSRARAARPRCAGRRPRAHRADRELRQDHAREPAAPRTRLPYGRSRRPPHDPRERRESAPTPSTGETGGATADGSPRPAGRFSRWAERSSPLRRPARGRTPTSVRALRHLRPRLPYGRSRQPPPASRPTRTPRICPDDRGSAGGPERSSPLRRPAAERGRHGASPTAARTPLRGDLTTCGSWSRKPEPVISMTRTMTGGG
ncbi:hypothetical protein RKD27_004472 [Streptomyces sp. SAI-126]